MKLVTLIRPLGSAKYTIELFFCNNSHVVDKLNFILKYPSGIGQRNRCHYVELTAQQERVIFFSLLLYLTHNRLGEMTKSGEESAAA